MKIIPQIDTYPGLVAVCQKPWGKMALLEVFAVALYFNGVVPWLELTALAMLLSFLPSRRRLLLSLGTLYWLIAHHAWFIKWHVLARIAKSEGQRTDWSPGWLQAILLAGIFCGVWMYFRHVIRWRGSFLARHSAFVLVGGFLSLLLAAGILPLHGAARMLVWSILVLLSPYLWFFAYSLQDAAFKAPDAFTRQFGTFHPFWLGSLWMQPVPKGSAYLRRVEALNAKDFSIVRLKAVKLLLWITVLNRLVLEPLKAVAYGGTSPVLLVVFGHAGRKLPALSFPTLEAAIQQTASGAPLPADLAWASVIGHFMTAILVMYCNGNLIVACCRMAGFKVLRSSYRPLQAVTIAEFWNRYNYYFKELLTDFFFYPTYLRYFKHSRLRTFIATLSAATLGQFVYHIIRDYHYFQEVGLSKAICGFQVYAFFTLVLGLGIAISQVGSTTSRRDLAGKPLYRRVLASVLVMMFFALLEVFDFDPSPYTLVTHLKFFFSLFSYHS